MLATSTNFGILKGIKDNNEVSFYYFKNLFHDYFNCDKTLCLYSFAESEIVCVRLILIIHKLILWGTIFRWLARIWQWDCKCRYEDWYYHQSIFIFRPTWASEFYRSSLTFVTRIFSNSNNKIIENLYLENNVILLWDYYKNKTLYSRR